MAFVKDATDALGNTYPSAYWRMGFVAVDTTDYAHPTIRFEYHAYRSKTDYQTAGRAIIIDRRSYTIRDPAVVGALVASDLANSVNVSTLAEGYAAGTPDDSATGGQPFFAGATPAA